MYVEVTPLVEGQNFHLEIRNVPPSSDPPILVISGAYGPTDLGPYGIPGYLGPDLGSAVLYFMSSNTLDGVTPTGIAGAPLYIQAYVKTPNGGRLSSMVTAWPIVPGTDPGTNPNIQFPLPLLTQEVLSGGRTGVAFTQSPVRVGIPLPRGQIFENKSNEDPQMTLNGPSTVGQFSTLAKWPDGSLKWVLVEYLTDLAAGAVDTSFSVDRGSGDFGGPKLLTKSGNVRTIDTGAIVVKFDASTDDLFDSFKRNGREVFNTSKGNRPRYVDDQDVEWTWHETSDVCTCNGPVRAEVRIDGVFTRTTSLTDPDRVYARFYCEACKGGTSVRVTASLRDTSVQYPMHLQFRGFTWRAWLNESGRMDIVVPQAKDDDTGPAVWKGSLNSSSDTASYYQGFARTTKIELTTDPNDNGYVPFIQRYDDDYFAIEGVRARIGKTYFSGSAGSNWFTKENEFADPTFMEINAQGARGLLFGIEHANQFWPVELQTGGDGRVEIALFPVKETGDTYNYGMPYATAETRTFWIEAEGGPSASANDEAMRFDYPLAARGELWVYNQSNVWHWRLVTDSDVSNYVAQTGLRQPQPSATNAVRTIYRSAAATGGGNNNWEETRRFCRWLRSGSGGAYLNSLFEAYYKVDKLPWSIDDDVLANRKKILNPTAPVTHKDDFYDNSKHMFMQAVPDWGYARGEMYLLDSERNFSETIRDPVISANVQPGGSFTPQAYAAMTNAATAILDLDSDPTLESWLHDIYYQWANIVFKVDNNFGVDTTTVGWQAPIGTPPGSAGNPDAYMISWSTGHSSDRKIYGYLTQAWTDLRAGALSYQNFVRHLREVNPTDPLINDLTGRAGDWYHYAHRPMPDDHQGQTGDYYQLDVFDGDADNQDPDPFSPPGAYIGFPDQTSYANQSLTNFLLSTTASETAYSYGVELHRGMTRQTYDDFVNEPIVNEFMWRYLVHYGLKTP